MRPSSADDRLHELSQTAEAVGKLSEDKKQFERLIAAFQARNAEEFQAILGGAGLLDRCRLICRFYCSKHCIFVCYKLCGGPVESAKELPVSEWREFSQAVARIAKDRPLLERFVGAVDREDAKLFNELIAKERLQGFCHQLCHWLCWLSCQLVCELLCPPRPTITEVGLIPTSQIDAQGRASGPSHPPGPTSADNKPAGAGDHPFGSLANVKGVFGIPSAVQYKVEFAISPLGPWTPILQPIADYKFDPVPPPIFVDYNRVPDGSGWYNISEMGLDGPDYLTDWLTPAGPNDLYYLKLTVRTAALVEFESDVVPARVDNVQPTKPVIALQLKSPDGTIQDLGCCEKVERGKGNVIVITLQASDANFSHIDVTLLGGCGASYSIVDKNGTSLSKTYNGDVTDTGYPAPTSFEWDPWSANISPCCYIIDVRIYDRAIIDNAWYGGHANENWQSITIA